MAPTGAMPVSRSAVVMIASPVLIDRAATCLTTRRSIGSGGPTRLPDVLDDPSQPTIGQVVCIRSSVMRTGRRDTPDPEQLQAGHLPSGRFGPAGGATVATVPCR